MAMVIRGGEVLDQTGTAFERADILIKADRITAVAADIGSTPDAQVLDASGQVVLPGLVNAHTHAHNNLLRGLAESWTLESLLNRGTALYGERTPEEQYLSAMLGALEMLRTGTTAAYDLFMALPYPSDESVEAVARAYLDVGVRAVIAPAVADLVFYRTVPGLLDLLPASLRSVVERLEAPPTAEVLRLSHDAIRRWHGAGGGRLAVHVAPTIPGQCTDELLSGCGRLAAEHGVGLHTHLAETKVQVVHARHRWGMTIVAALAERGVLSPGFVGAHGIWLTDDDIRRLADAGATVVHNPASNLRTGAGIAPVREMLDEGLVVALGTDGTMASDNLSMFESMRFAALSGTVRFPHARDRWIDGPTAWRMATAGSARALGLKDTVGAVAPGQKADLVLLRRDSSSLHPLNHALNALVFMEAGWGVDTVLVDGRVVLERGRITTVDEAAVRRRAAEAADRARARYLQASSLADRLVPYLDSACRAAVRVQYPVNRYAVSLSGSD